jgi:hypothetical protein
LSPSTSGSSLPAAAAVAASGAGEQETEYVVLNFYHLVDIPDAEEVGPGITSVLLVGGMLLVQ